MNTPWGMAQDVNQLAPGIVSVSTASHGGIKLDADHNAKVADYWRAADGWYEEDCEWAVVAVTFPKAFTAAALVDARSILANWKPDQYGRFIGRKLTAAESWKIREREFHAANGDRFLVNCAWGDWHKAVPDGMVGVSARRASDRQERYFLVPADEYGQRDCTMSFVVDEARHVAWVGVGE